ncbi:stress-regulated transcription factor RPN4 [Aspergillus homomorphus CBS 101889]|uniref:C2H2-type domain-containing protein n=1 Tax=Aspergillus homomorphus (strain CBS 101889) TaxID=1450537 RepID=A0A395IB97_ASPHC|nr:hypothetical protein BO97DRAFT_420475 [Aspergillus homomorphus CBS 101889]RAL17089.1 hypothetical protein BO97DRAFT_420475 [Aspergillus homomorphus CBS 101889]
MFMHPAVRKGFITEPTSVPFYNHQDPVCIQDDQFLPEYSQEAVYHQPRLQTPFQYHPNLQFVSPPSPAPSSPTSSPASTVSHYPTTAVAADYSSAVFDSNSFEAPSMTPSSSYNPSINYQHSPSPQASQPYFFHPYYDDNAQMLAQHSVPNNHGWDGNLQLLNPARIQNNLSRMSQYNQEAQMKAASSPSSSRSAPAGGSYQRSNGQCKPLPTPSQTPVQNSVLASSFQDGNRADAELAMRRAVMEQQQKQQMHQQQQQPQQQQQQYQPRHQHQSSDYSLAPSVSTVSQNSPVTPQTGFEEIDESSKTTNGEKRFPDVDKWMDDYLHLDSLSDYTHQTPNNMTIGIPKLNRTISDIYQDELYNPALMPTPQVPKQPTNQQNMLAPTYRNVIADRLQAANQGHLSARSQSPMGSIQRDRSPFRQNSPMAAEYNSAALQHPQMATSVPGSQNGVSIAASSQNEPKTMSPKDALLDYNEGDDSELHAPGMPLFPPSSQPDFNLGDALSGLRRESSSSYQPTQNFTSMEAFPAQYATHASGPQYHFGQQQQQQQQQSSRQAQSQQNSLLHQTPEFPASLPRFDSTGSEILPTTEMTSPQGQPRMAIQPVKAEIPRPENTSSDSGTYTCTYHGCTLRFETPAKLQKHKREAHRQTTPGGHLIGRDNSARNSQAGPHKCERINPSTGKPCNSIFSRPYDLTRHEDTIHNARKQKVRCHLCTEEKTFSRNDALTRHMRVVHPEVDWPGKQRRRGRE